MFMKFDFDYSTDRRETDSLKWDTAMVKYPMWVADMDFQVAPSIQEVVHESLWLYTFTKSFLYIDSKMVAAKTWHRF